MKYLTSCTPEEIIDELKIIIPGSSPAGFRGKQIFSWIYKGIQNFNEMTDLPPDLREELQNRITLYSSSIESRHTDPDGTLKLKIRLHDGLFIESVLLTDQEDRKTACLSSQAGCAMGCSFCRTGEMGLNRDLDPGEIAEQFLHLESEAGTISHIVFMGMGEALHNYANFIKSVELLSHPGGRNISPRRMTVSTCGLIPEIRRLADDGVQVRLAVSLNSARKEIREEIMPVSKTNPLPALKKTLQYYQQIRGKRITLEYVMIGGKNDSKEDLSALRRFAEGLNVAVNIIPWNPVPESSFTPPSERKIQQFQKTLERDDIPVTRRYRRGRGVNGACGQLAT